MACSRSGSRSAPEAKPGVTGLFGRQKKVKAKSLQVFSRQFATMIEAGLSVVTALVILEQQTDDPALALVIDDVREQVEARCSRGNGGASDHVQPALHRDGRGGRGAGVLDNVLDRVATQIEKEQKIKRRVRGAMIYPTVVLRSRRSSWSAC